MRAVRHLTHDYKNYNGGYITYWSLIFKQMPSMIASIGPQLKAQLKEQEKLCTGVFGPLRLAIVKTLLGFLVVVLAIKIIIKMPWWLFIKPLGSILFYTRKRYEVAVADDTQIIQYKRNKQIYLFRLIPIPCMPRHKPTKKDLEILFKDDAPNMVFAPVRNPLYV